MHQQRFETLFGSQHVESIRIFRVDVEKMLLKSVAKEDIWLPGEIKMSKCAASRHPDVKPEVGCTCGLWACKSRKAMYKTYQPIIYSASSQQSMRPFFMQYRQDYVVSARIQQWGIVIEHEWGYRSEYARIIPETIQMYPRQDKVRYRNLIKELRRKYST